LAAEPSQWSCLSEMEGKKLVKVKKGGVFFVLFFTCGCRKEGL